MAERNNLIDAAYLGYLASLTVAEARKRHDYFKVFDTWMFPNGEWKGSGISDDLWFVNDSQRKLRLTEHILAYTLASILAKENNKPTKPVRVMKSVNIVDLKSTG